MIITIELPDWALERHISIMAGMELVAYKPYGGELIIKEVRCNNCGWCCENLVSRSMPTDEKGACIYLETIGQAKECSLGLTRPWRCCWSDPLLTKYPEAEKNCCIRYK